jgi:PAS domain-containing protein
MRQWELIGITDSDPSWTPPRRPAVPDPTSTVSVAPAHRDELRGDAPALLWSTDAALRMRSVTPAAAALLGCDPDRCEGRDLLDVFGMEGPSLAVLEAHVAALSDEEGLFTLRGNLEVVRCRVSPMHDELGSVIGTFCIALPDPAPVAAQGRGAHLAA